MKKKLQKTLGIACVAAIFAACIVTNEKGDPFWVNYALLAVAGLAGFTSNRLTSKERRVK